MHRAKNKKKVIDRLCFCLLFPPSSIHPVCLYRVLLFLCPCLLVLVLVVVVAVLLPIARSPILNSILFTPFKIFHFPSFSQPIPTHSLTYSFNIAPYLYSLFLFLFPLFSLSLPLSLFLSLTLFFSPSVFFPLFFFYFLFSSFSFFLLFSRSFASLLFLQTPSPLNVHTTRTLKTHP